MRAGGVSALKSAVSASRPGPAYTPFLLSSSRRQYSTTESTSSPEEVTQALGARWLSDTKKRIGHCITFGLKPHQTREAGEIMQEVARDWRELVVGSEGFLTSRTRRSIFRLPVVWGEQDAMVRSAFPVPLGPVVETRQVG